MSDIISFALAGIILIIGFIGNYLFKKTSVPDIIILILIGFLIGPVFGIINPIVLAPISQLFASLALLIILFDGGLNLDLKKVVQDSPRAGLMAFLGVFVAMIFTALFTHFVLGWNILTGLLLGSILGGTSSSVVIPLISRIKVDCKISTLLSLESAFTDAIVVVVSLALLQFLLTPETTSLSSAAGSIVGAFSIAVVMGLAVGAVWLKVLKDIRGETYDDILTLAIVLLFYAITEYFGGNGAIFALTFGMVLGNGIRISKVLGYKKGIRASKFMKKFESQISFFIRTFFFVYLGLILVVNNPMSLIYSLVLMGVLVFGRYISIVISSIKEKTINANKLLMTSMLPRGLAAAVLAQIVMTYKIPGTEIFSDIIILIIIYSVVISAVGASFMKSSIKKAECVKNKRKS